MKKHTAKILAGILLLSVALTAWSSTVLIGSLTTVNNTTANSSAITLITLSIADGTFYITDGGLTATTALVINDQWSLDQTNYVTEATWSPGATNAGTFTWTPGTQTPPIYQRIQIITTNSVNVGVIKQ